jgi:hypothetical protein
MANLSACARALEQEGEVALEEVGSFPSLRVLAWNGSVLYASRGYTLLAADLRTGTDPVNVQWKEVAQFRPPWWRKLTASSRLSVRLFRDGFHCLTVLPSGNLVGAVPGAIIIVPAGSTEFMVSHVITRGTRPLHFASAPDGQVFFGEYFDNPDRDPVYIYGSNDEGKSWHVIYTFSRGEIRHVHNIIYDEWENCLWILSGDYAAECRILRASLDFKQVETVLAGNQQARAVAIVPTKDSLYFSSDTPLERNHVYRLDRTHKLSVAANLSSSSIYGCRVGEILFFSTMVEPSDVNQERKVCLYGGGEHSTWNMLRSWKKDLLPMRFFQYGNAILPDGNNTSGLLAMTTIAVENEDLQTTIFKLGRTKSADL